MHSPAVAFAARNGCHLASFDVRSAAVDCAALPFGPLERRPRAPKRLKFLRTGPSHPFWHAPVAHRPLCVCSTMSKARRQIHAAQLHPGCLQHLQLQALMQTQMLNLPCAVELQHGLVFGGLHTCQSAAGTCSWRTGYVQAETRLCWQQLTSRYTLPMEGLGPRFMVSMSALCRV